MEACSTAFVFFLGAVLWFIMYRRLCITDGIYENGALRLSTNNLMTLARRASSEDTDADLHKSILLALSLWQRELPLWFSRTQKAETQNPPMGCLRIPPMLKSLCGDAIPTKLPRHLAIRSKSTELPLQPQILLLRSP